MGPGGHLDPKISEEGPGVGGGGGGGGWERNDVVPSTPPLLPFFSDLHFAPLSTI